MNLGLRNRHISSAAEARDQHAAGLRVQRVAGGREDHAGAAAISVSHTSFSPTPLDAFTSTTSPGRSNAGEQRRRSAGVRRMVVLTVKPVRHRRRERPDRHQHVGDAIRVARRSHGDSARHPDRARACPPARRPAGRRLSVGGERVERGPHRHRICVVGVVDQRHPTVEQRAAGRGRVRAPARAAHPGVTPTARAAATAASRSWRRCGSREVDFKLDALRPASISTWVAISEAI